MSSYSTKTIARLCSSVGLSLWIAFAGSSALAQRQLLDRVIAIVDEDVVLMSELEDRLNDIRGQARANNEPLPPDSELRSQVLEVAAAVGTRTATRARAGTTNSVRTCNGRRTHSASAARRLPAVEAPTRTTRGRRFGS